MRHIATEETPLWDERGVTANSCSYVRPCVVQMGVLTGCVDDDREKAEKEWKEHSKPPELPPEDNIFAHAPHTVSLMIVNGEQGARSLIDSPGDSKEGTEVKIELDDDELIGKFRSVRALGRCTVSAQTRFGLRKDDADDQTNWTKSVNINVVDRENPGEILGGLRVEMQCLPAGPALRLFDEYDTDSSGTLSRAEFSAFVHDLKVVGGNVNRLEGFVARRGQPEIWWLARVLTVPKLGAVTYMFKNHSLTRWVMSDALGDERCAQRLERLLLALFLLAWSIMANCLGTAIAKRNGYDALYQYPLIILLDILGAILLTAYFELALNSVVKLTLSKFRVGTASEESDHDDNSHGGRNAEHDANTNELHDNSSLYHLLCRGGSMTMYELLCKKLRFLIMVLAVLATAFYVKFIAEQGDSMDVISSFAMTIPTARILEFFKLGTIWAIQTEYGGPGDGKVFLKTRQKPNWQETKETMRQRSANYANGTQSRERSADGCWSSCDCMGDEPGSKGSLAAVANVSEMVGDNDDKENSDNDLERRRNAGMNENNEYGRAAIAEEPDKRDQLPERHSSLTFSDSEGSDEERRQMVKCPSSWRERTNVSDLAIGAELKFTSDPQWSQFAVKDSVQLLAEQRKLGGWCAILAHDDGPWPDRKRMPGARVVELNAHDDPKAELVHDPREHADKTAVRSSGDGGSSGDDWSTIDELEVTVCVSPPQKMSDGTITRQIELDREVWEAVSNQMLSSPPNVTFPLNPVKSLMRELHLVDRAAAKQKIRRFHQQRDLIAQARLRSSQARRWLTHFCDPLRYQSDCHDFVEHSCSGAEIDQREPPDPDLPPVVYQSCCEVSDDKERQVQDKRKVQLNFQQLRKQSITRHHQALNSADLSVQGDEKEMMDTARAVGVDHFKRDLKDKIQKLLCHDEARWCMLV